VSNVPFGSAWAVLPFIPPALRGKEVAPWGIQTRSLPANAYSARIDNFIGELDPGTVIIVGETVDDISLEKLTKVGYAQWVEVLLPFKCYVNRVHFNADSETLRQVG